MTDINDPRLPMWNLFNSPTDFPGMYVARLFYNDEPQDKVLICEDLAELRKIMINKGLARLERHDSDPAQFIETWL